MAPPGSPEIPQEIIDEVIDLCSREKKTLKACSLISRAWVYRTRKHLFSKLTLTDKTLPAWCSVVVTPTSGTPSAEHAHPHATCPSPSYTPSLLSSHVTSLHLAFTYPQTPSNPFEEALLRADTHFTAFINLNSLTLSAISFIALQSATIRACFGPFAKSVRELKLSVCSLDGKFSAFLKMFTHLEALELNGNTWTSRKLPEWTDVLPNGLPTLPGSFKASNITHAGIGLLDAISTVRAECHTITIGHSPSPTYRQFNALFAKCKDHLEILVLTAADSVLGVSGADLSPCGKLVEIHVRFSYAKLAPVIATLRSVSSHRFRKLTLLITPPIPWTNPRDWAKLDKEVSVLAKRVGVTAGNDTLEVVICSYLTDLGGTGLSETGRALPLISRNACVSLRTVRI